MDGKRNQIWNPIRPSGLDDFSVLLKLLEEGGGSQIENHAGLDAL